MIDAVTFKFRRVDLFFYQVQIVVHRIIGFLQITKTNVPKTVQTPVDNAVSFV